eukprot:6191816-Pleurochrysis_carterae.AAC.4
MDEMCSETELVSDVVGSHNRSVHDLKRIGNDDRRDRPAAKKGSSKTEGKRHRGMLRHMRMTRQVTASTDPRVFLHRGSSYTEEHLRGCKHAFSDSHANVPHS